MEIVIKIHMKNIIENFTNNSHVIQETIIFTNSDTLEVSANDFGPGYQRTIRMWILAIMFTLSLIGNTLVVGQLLLLRRERFPKSKVMFLNLAAADLFVAFGSMLSQLIWELMDHKWIAGNVFCKFFKFSQTYSLSSSTFMVVAIALDRYNAIVKPFSFSPDPKWYAIGAWIIGLLPSLPSFIVFHDVQISDSDYKCVSKFYTSPENQMWRKLYMMCVFISAFFVPFVLLLVLYFIIIKEIRTRSSVFTHDQQTGSSLPKAHIKTLKLTNAILTSFLIINLPYIVQEIVITFGYAEILNENVSAFAGVVSASNSAINPFIYLIFQSKVTSLKECFCNLVDVVRCRKLSVPDHSKNDTSFLSASPKNLQMNLVTVVPQTQIVTELKISKDDRKVEETFL